MTVGIRSTWAHVWGHIPAIPWSEHASPAVPAPRHRPSTPDRHALQFFAADYYSSRHRFRALTQQLGWALHSYPIEATGPGGEPLSIEVAVAPGNPLDPVLLLSSGVHGVEGFFGGAMQLACMQQWLTSGAPVGVRPVLIHAVSPYGFAHLRRFGEGNVDQNRNCLIPGEEFRGCPPMYATLDILLNPRTPPMRSDPYPLRSAWAVAHHGVSSLKQSIAGGQYEFPKGVFYGGRSHSQSLEILGKHMPEWLAEAGRVVHFDFHTGLGRWGDYTLLMDAPLTPKQIRWTERWLDRTRMEASVATGVAYHTHGSFGPWCVSHNPQRDYIYLCAEYGTYWHFSVFAGVRAENQAHHWGRGPNDPRTLRAKARLKELFCPASPAWRTTVVNRTLDLVDQAIVGLSSPGEK